MRRRSLARAPAGGTSLRAPPPVPSTRWSRAREALFGRPLRSSETGEEALGTLSAVPVLGLDALASAAYGPEAALTVLLPAGVWAPGWIVPITVCIVAVLLAVFFSYRQTIAAYPQGGGSFPVAKQNLGRTAGLLAAVALCIDYVLNVAVAISTGVGSLVSACPVLLAWTLPLCLAVLLLLALVNFRGVRTAGLLFMLPTACFIGCLVAAIGIGAAKLWLTRGHPAPLIVLPRLHAPAVRPGPWLLLRAFASGCTALTGIEAVSNGVPLFRPPKPERARHTLAIILVLLAVLLLGIAWVVRGYGIQATRPGERGYQSILSLIAGAVAGRGGFYYFSMASVLTMLVLSANTSFADFPRVCRMLALDEFMPASFAHRGRRLVFSHGITLLTLVSGFILVVFRGVTDRLIPLFAVGAFLAFTLSQLGMVARWWRRLRRRGALRSLCVNGLGAAATAATLIVIAISKFRSGAWLTIAVIPLLLWSFRRYRRRQERLDRTAEPECPVELDEDPPPLVVVPLKRMNSVARKALRFALTLSGEVRAVQILTGDPKLRDLRPRWAELAEAPARRHGYRPPQLTVIQSPYREFFGPLVGHIQELSAEFPHRAVAVVIPELTGRAWYEPFLRPRSALLRNLLLLHCGPRILIISAPWYADDPAETRRRRGTGR